MKALLSDKREVAKETMWFKFKLEKAIKFKPGQFFFISIAKLKYPDDLGNTRHFSIVNPPTENNFIEMATRMSGSGFKETLKQLPLGSQVEITSITGEFVLPQNINKPLVFIAGGIGITPFMSMLRFLEGENLPYKISLFYSNKDRETAPFFDNLEKIANEKPYLKLVPIMTNDRNWTGENSRINEEILKKYLVKLSSYTYFVAGPPLFNQAVAQILEKANISKENLEIENFTGYTSIYGIKD